MKHASLLPREVGLITIHGLTPPDTQMAEVAVRRTLFAAILDRTLRLRAVEGLAPSG